MWTAEWLQNNVVTSFWHHNDVTITSRVQWECIWKCRLRNSINFVLASMCKNTEYHKTSGLGSNTYLYLQIQIQIQIQCICICICIWSNFKPCICICIWSTVFGVFNKYVFKYTFFPGPFSKHKFMEHKLTWILFINMLKSAILFKNKCRVLILLIPICARWLCVHLIWLVNEHVTNHQLNIGALI